MNGAAGGGSTLRQAQGAIPPTAERVEAPGARPLVMGVHGADTARPLVMGVLNVTPDSFSDGGEFLQFDAAIARGLQLAAEGADIVDVGGESTRPGAQPVPSDEEARRVLPVIRALVASGVAVSIDTIHADTARAAVAAGATVINDVSGGLHDPEMRAVAAESAATYIAMHWRGVPDPRHRRSEYADVVAEVREDLGRLADAALAAGVAPERIVLDPGLGFDKTAEQGWQLLAGIPRLAELGYPVLVGASRKRMIAETLSPLVAHGEVTTQDRDLATAVVSALSAGVHAWGVRVHAVAPTVRALTVAEAWRAGAESSGHVDRLGDRSDRSSSVPTGRPPWVASFPSTGSGNDATGSGNDATDAGRGLAAAPELPADRITLSGLEVFAHHGVFDFERERGQRFVIDAELTVDLRAAAGGDDLARTVHYGELAEAIVAAVERDPVDLIETVAERVAAVALGFPGVAEVRATVHKPDAPIAASFADVSVTVVRRGAGDSGGGAAA